MSPGPAFGRITSQNNLFNGIASGIGPGPHQCSHRKTKGTVLSNGLFKAPLRSRSWLPPVALPGAIAPQTPPDEKFLSLNRWRKPSGVLSRNWWWKLLSGNELQIERLSLFFKPFDALEPELFFVMFDTLFDIVLSVTQHAID